MFSLSCCLCELWLPVLAELLAGQSYSQALRLVLRCNPSVSIWMLSLLTSPLYLPGSPLSWKGALALAAEGVFCILKQTRNQRYQVAFLQVGPFQLCGMSG